MLLIFGKFTTNSYVTCDVQHFFPLVALIVERLY